MPKSDPEREGEGEGEGKAKAKGEGEGKAEGKEGRETREWERTKQNKKKGREGVDKGERVGGVGLCGSFSRFVEDGRLLVRENFLSGGHGHEQVDVRVRAYCVFGCVGV